MQGFKNLSRFSKDDEVRVKLGHSISFIVVLRWAAPQLFTFLTTMFCLLTLVAWSVWKLSGLVWSYVGLFSKNPTNILQLLEFIKYLLKNDVMQQYLMLWKIYNTS